MGRILASFDALQKMQSANPRMTADDTMVFTGPREHVDSIYMYLGDRKRQRLAEIKGTHLNRIDDNTLQVEGRDMIKWLLQSNLKIASVEKDWAIGL